MILLTLSLLPEFSMALEYILIATLAISIMETINTNNEIDYSEYYKSERPSFNPFYSYNYILLLISFIRLTISSIVVLSSVGSNLRQRSHSSCIGHSSHNLPTQLSFTNSRISLFGTNIFTP